MNPTATSSPAAAPRLDFGPPGRLDDSLSGLVRGMRGSEILRIAAGVRRLVAEGKPVCNLTVGDFDPRHFPVPASLLEATREALGRGETNYPPSNGLLSLREAVTRRVEHDYGIRYPVESVLVAGGVRPLLYAAFRAVVDPGDAVVYGVPSWNTNHYIWLTQGRPVPVTAARERGFHPTAEQLEGAIRDAAMVCLCSPANPTGTMLDGEELRRITELVAEENRRREREGRRVLFLLYDQVYGSLVHAGVRHANPVALVPEAAPWTIVLDGISKAFAATGLRVGWSLAAPAVTARMSDFLGHVGAWAPRPEQAATAGFLRDDEAIGSFREAMDAGIKARLDALVAGFTELRNEGYPVDWVRPEGAIYFSLRLDLAGRSLGGMTVATNDDIARLLLEHAGIAVVPFQAFGLDEESGWFRLSIGAVSLEDIAAALPRIRRLLAGS